MPSYRIIFVGDKGRRLALLSGCLETAGHRVMGTVSSWRDLEPRCRQLRPDVIVVVQDGRGQDVPGRTFFLDGRHIPVVPLARVVRDGREPDVRMVDRALRQQLARTRPILSSEEMEEIYRYSFLNSSDIFYFISQDLKILAISPSIERILGYTPDELCGRRAPLEKMLTPAQIKEALANFWRALRGRNIKVLTLTINHKNGQERILEIKTAGRLKIGGRWALAGVARDITDWRRAVSEIERSEAFYRTLVETTDTGYVVLDLGGRVMDANQEYLRLTGHRSISSVVGHRMEEWVAPSDRELLNMELVRCRRRGWIRMLEVNYLHPDGRLLPVEINASVVDADEGRRMIALCRDCSRRREVEAALRESERMYRTLVQSQGEGIAITDGNERFVFANPAAEELFGVGPGGLIGRSLKEFSTPDQYLEIQRQTGMRKLGKRSSYELDIIRRDGQRRRILLTAVPQSDREGRFLGTFGVFRDITDRVRAEEALRLSEERYRTLVETSPDAILVWDLSGRVTAGNRRAVQLHGLEDISQLKEQSLYQFLVAEDRERIAQAMARIASQQTVERINYRMRRYDGSPLDCELSASALPDAQGRPALFVGVIRDISEKVKMEKEILDIGERVQRSIGHDLHDNVNQLLTVASLRLKAVQHKMEDGRLPDEEELNLLADMLKQAMVSISQLARGLSPLSLEQGRLALGLKQLANLVASEEISCRAEVDETIEVDSNTAIHLYRIAQEAVNNAIKHSGASSIVISFFKEGRDLVLEVSDNGRGLADRRGSRGMGLNLMRYRADMIYAELSILPGREKGTTVSCRLRERNVPGGE